jgi:hypothetical protein
MCLFSYRRHHLTGGVLQIVSMTCSLLQTTNTVNGSTSVICNVIYFVILLLFQVDAVTVAVTILHYHLAGV